MITIFMWIGWSLLQRVERDCSSRGENVHIMCHFDFVDIPGDGANTKMMWSIAKS